MQPETGLPSRTEIAAEHIVAGFAGIIRKAGVYSSDHPTLVDETDHFTAQLDLFFTIEPQISLRIEPGRLYINDERIRNVQWARVLADTFHQRRIRTLSLRRGFDRYQLGSFLKLIKRDPLYFRKPDAWEGLIAESGLNSVTIQEQKYDSDADRIVRQLAELDDNPAWRIGLRTWQPDARPKNVDEELSEPHLEQVACANLIILLELNKASADYPFFALGVGDKLLELMRTGQYKSAARLMRVLRRHAGKGNPAEASRTAARKVLMRLRNPELAEELIFALRKWGKSEAKYISALLAGLGKIGDGTVIHALNEEPDRAIRAVLIDVLGKAGKRIYPHILENLKHPEWFVVRNMVALLAKVDPEQLTESLDPLISHNEPRVRKEIARALRSADDPRAVTLLAKLIDDPDMAICKQAVLSLGFFHDYDDAARALARSLTKKHPFDGDFSAEKLALSALGGFRSISFISVFSKYILEAGVLKSFDEELVEAAAKALADLGDTDGWEVLDKGRKSRNRAVRKTCNRLYADMIEGDS
jgi:HEAT repeats